MRSQATHAQLPGETFTIDAQVRNVKELAVTVSSIPLDRSTAPTQWLNDPDTWFGDPEQTWDAAVKHPASGPQVGVRSRTRPATTARTVPSPRSSPFPALENGAYVLEARSGELVWRSLCSSPT